MSDLISRQAAITIPVMPKEHRHYQTNNLDDAYDQGWFDLQNYIEQLPSAEPQERKGHWILHTYMPHKKYCSWCNADSPYNTRWSYCPNCGTKMEVENETD